MSFPSIMNAARARARSLPAALSAANNAPRCSRPRLDTLHRGSCLHYPLELRHLRARTESSDVRAGERGGNTELQHAWTMLGQPDKYDAAKGHELKDLADHLRHRKRGELAQNRRLKANWQLYERMYIILHMCRTSLPTTALCGQPGNKHIIIVPAIFSPPAAP